MRILSDKLSNFLGQEVTVEGWVNSRRDHGGLIFIDLRDHAGIIQLVVTPDTEESFKLAESVRDEYVLRATGKMRERAPEENRAGHDFDVRQDRSAGRGVAGAGFEEGVRVVRDGARQYEGHCRDG